MRYPFPLAYNDLQSPPSLTCTQMYPQIHNYTIFHSLHTSPLGTVHSSSLLALPPQSLEPHMFLGCPAARLSLFRSGWCVPGGCGRGEDDYVIEETISIRSTTTCELQNGPSLTSFSKSSSVSVFSSWWTVSTGGKEWVNVWFQSVSVQTPSSHEEKWSGEPSQISCASTYFCNNVTKHFVPNLPKKGVDTQVETTYCCKGSAA